MSIFGRTSLNWVSLRCKNTQIEFKIQCSFRNYIPLITHKTLFFKPREVDKLCSAQKLKIYFNHENHKLWEMIPKCQKLHIKLNSSPFLLAVNYIKTPLKIIISFLRIKWSLFIIFFFTKLESPSPKYNLRQGIGIAACSEKKDEHL